MSRLEPRLRTAEDVVEWLTKQYPPKCIQAGEDPIDAHRYAAKAELVMVLRRKVQHSEAANETSEVEIT